MSDSQVKIGDLIAEPFYKVHSAIKQGQYDQIILQGGRGSLKSSFASIQIILGIIKDPKANAIVIRKVADTIRNSVYSTLMWAIDELKVRHLFKDTTSPAEILYKPTGQKIIFRGLDKPVKLKSIKMAKGYFKYLWFEEANEFKGMEELRNVEQSVLRGGDSFVEFITFNPDNDPNHWLNKEVLLNKKGRLLHSSTYLDAPIEWLGKKFIEDAEYLRESNPLAYDNEYLGQAVGNNEAIIFSGKYSIEDFEIKSTWDGAYFGADWGFSQDPTVLVKCYIEILANNRKRLYISHEQFGYNVELDDIPAMFDKIDGARTTKIRADCARPETISFLRRKGFDIVAAEKWQGSVEDGIEVLKSFDKIVIHTRCKKMAEEARLYSYKIDRVTRDITTTIVDKYNHGWDSVRYALAPFIKNIGNVFDEEFRL